MGLLTTKLIQSIIDVFVPDLSAIFRNDFIWKFDVMDVSLGQFIHNDADWLFIG